MSARMEPPPGDDTPRKGVGFRRLECPHDGGRVRRRFGAIGALALLVLALPVARGGDRATWQPENTFVFMAGIIEWPKAAGLSSFTDEKRLDTKLASTLRAAGVPEANLVFLEDKDATRENIRARLGEVAARAGEGTTLIFY